jgi:hypothetical protein
MWQREDGGRPIGNAAENSRQRGAENAQQDCAVNLSRHQDQRENKAQAGDLHFLIGKAAKSHIGGGVGDYQLGIAQADESDEHANSRGG